MMTSLMLLHAKHKQVWEVGESSHCHDHIHICERIFTVSIFKYTSGCLFGYLILSDCLPFTSFIDDGKIVKLRLHLLSTGHLYHNNIVL